MRQRVAVTVQGPRLDPPAPGPAGAGNPPAAPAGAGREADPGAPPRFETLSLARIRVPDSALRGAPGPDLDALARSLAAGASALAQCPAVEALGAGAYRLIFGARRVAAARQAGWTAIPCLVYPRLDPLVAHTLRLRENLHRAALDPLGEAAALQVLWLMANADALGRGGPARAILARAEPPAATAPRLARLLADAGWRATRPAVPWDGVLDDLGLDLDPAARRRRLRVLRLDPALHAPLQGLGLTAAALGALGALSPEQQAILVAALRREPALAPKVRRISRVVRGKRYTLDEALDEARGAGTAPAAAGAGSGDDSPPRGARGDSGRAAGGADPAAEASPAAGLDPGGVDPPRPAPVSPGAQAAITELLALANQLAEALGALRADTGGAPLAGLPAPWGDYGRTALQLIGAVLRANGE
jgi:hypothetical protein